MRRGCVFRVGQRALAVEIALDTLLAVKSFNALDALIGLDT